MRRGVVYALVDPRTGEVRYVGKTVRPLSARTAQAVWHAKNGMAGHKSAWLRELLGEGLAPVQSILEEVTAGEASFAAELASAERGWVLRGRAAGWPLTNMSAGGEGVVGHGATTGARISAALKGREFSDEHRRRLSEAGAGRRHPQEVIDRIAESQRGKKLSEAHKQALRDSRAGKTNTAEHNEKIAASRRGKPLSEAHKQKIREAHMRRKTGQGVI